MCDEAFGFAACYYPLLAALVKGSLNFDHYFDQYRD